MNNLPTVFQKKALWTAITAFSLTLTAVIVIAFIYTATQVLAFLQPFLVPFAIAGVLAYLLEPAVDWMQRKGFKRNRAVLTVFAAFLLLFTGIGWWLGAKVGQQAQNLDGKLGIYATKARDAVFNFANDLEKKYGIDIVPTLPSATAAKTQAGLEGPPAPAETAPDKSAKQTEGEHQSKASSNSSEELTLSEFLAGDWVKQVLPGLATHAWSFIRSSLGGFLGVFGFVLSLVIVPLYLYYFLAESVRIKKTWSNYLPLRASAFKDELVDCLNEINGYLVAFFRGQLFVSMINGVATGLGLMIIGLDFGLLIGLLLCCLGIIPYLGIILCWIPAVIIAGVQGGSALIPADPWWVMPLVVTCIFVVVQQIDGFFITPKIVGESVGLHPMTVIMSVVIWSLLLGGLLGAILAVPLSASLKVIFRRYVWHRRLAPQTIGGAAKPHLP